MKLLFDQNISFRILRYLPQSFNDSSHIKLEGLINATDRKIWSFAKRKDYTIVTQDADFSDLNSLYGFPPKIIWIRVGNIETASVAKLISDYYYEIEAFLNNTDHGCFEIIHLKK